MSFSIFGKKIYSPNSPIIPLFRIAFSKIDMALLGSGDLPGLIVLALCEWRSRTLGVESGRVIVDRYEYILPTSPLRGPQHIYYIPC